MTFFEHQCVKQDDTILSALAKLDKLSGQAMVVFVQNRKEQVIGTLTDGDIRRALLRGLEPSANVCDVMKTEFAFLKTDENDHTLTINAYRKRNITVVPLLDENNHLVKIYNLREIHSILPIDAVLMAGGKGERLRPLTEKIPKPLLPVGNKAIIDRNIERLISFGLEHIYVTVNYLKEQLEDHFAEPIQGVKVNTVCEPKYLGTMGSIRFVEQFHNDTILVMNSDLFTDIDYEDFYLHFKQNNADMSVAAVPYTVSVPYGIMDLEGRALKGMIEKPTYNYYANAGIYLIKRELLDLIPEDTFYNATDLIDDLVRIGNSIIRYPINGTWIDIGNPQEYQKAKDLVRHMKG